MQRILLREYEKYNLDTICNEFNIQKKELILLFMELNTKILKSLRLKKDVIEIGQNSIKVKGVSGIIRLNREIEVEIMPKFLRYCETIWKDDFFKLVTLIESGSLLVSEHINVSFSGNVNLHDILAKEFIRLFNNHKKYYIRKYTCQRYRSFEIEGDIEFDSLFDYHPDGTLQSHTKYSKKNYYNAVFLKACNLLVARVNSAHIKCKLSEIQNFLGPQNEVKYVNASIPISNRDRKWKDLYIFSCDIINNIGISYESGSLKRSPGYVFSTWQMWQKLLEVTVKWALNDKEVIAQKQFKFGTVESKSLNVHPDIVILNKISNNVELLIDAKYKGKDSEYKGSINNADIYESYAFCKASGCKKMLLIYPNTMGIENLGTLECFTSIKIDDIQIYGIQLDINNISSQNGFRTFIKNLRESLYKYI